MSQPVRTRGAVVLAVVLAWTAACGSSGGAASPGETTATTPITSSTTALPVDTTVNRDGTPPPTDESVDPATDDPACANFRSFVAANAACDRLVRPADAATCTNAAEAVLDCSSVPRIARIAQVTGAVVGGQPIRPDLEVTQFGRGPGPTNTSVLFFTEAPLPLAGADQLELAIVYETTGGPECAASGEAWDAGSFVSILRLGPGPARVTDLGCRPDGYAEISQRSSWLISGDIVIVYLPIDLPGAPARITGTFRAAPDFVFGDGRIATRRLEPTAWDFDAPIDP